MMNKASNYIHVEDFNKSSDSKFIKDFLVPYFKDLFKDLAVRTHTPTTNNDKIDKVTFIEYCNLPAIIGDRLFKMFDTNRDTLIAEVSFVNNLVKVFMSDLDTKMRMTFNM